MERFYAPSQDESGDNAITSAKSRPIAPSKRRIDKEGHRLVLLEATASAIIKYGIAGTTISRIQEISGVSRGMINLHFQSKDKLIVALAQHIDAEYQANRRRVSSSPSQTPRGRLYAAVRAEFSDEILNKKLGAVWMALRSECNARPDLRPYIETRDKAFYRELRQCFHQISKTTGKPRDGRRATLALMALIEGMLTDFHLHADFFDREEALNVCLFAV
ncbi:MAG: TetR family transcriptional regulator C-terminal domain-containing protein [Pseudomonadota bacterium]